MVDIQREFDWYSRSIQDIPNCRAQDQSLGTSCQGSRTRGKGIVGRHLEVVWMHSLSVPSCSNQIPVSAAGKGYAKPAIISFAAKYPLIDLPL
jgi:hypothetical protein